MAFITVGRGRFEANGITMSWSNDIEPGYQELWSRGRWLGWFEIGSQPHGLRCDRVVLNPIDFEAVKKSEMERSAVDRSRRFHDNRVKLPAFVDRFVKQKMRESRG